MMPEGLTKRMSPFIVVLSTKDLVGSSYRCGATAMAQASEINSFRTIGGFYA